MKHDNRNHEVALKSKDPCAPGTEFVLVAPPQSVAYRIDQLVVLEYAESWLIHSLMVGGREQLDPTIVPIRGDSDELRNLRALTCQTAMDVEVTVEYVRDMPRKGVPFAAKLIGTAVP